MVRQVGYKLGGAFQPLPLQDKATGLPIRDSENQIILASDFRRVLKEYADTPSKVSATWKGATVADIITRADLDMKPRRLVPRALDNVRRLKNAGAVPLGDIADIVEDTIDLIEDVGPSELRRVVEGADIRAIEGIVVPHFPERCWVIAERKQRKVYQLHQRDVVIGLVRPERRNVGILLDDDERIVGSPDGLAVARIKEGTENEFPIEWLFAVLRSEEVRLQFWTESGGTSYGKLDRDGIRSVLIPVATSGERRKIATKVQRWIDSVTANAVAWSEIGVQGDRRPILNSPLTGLFDEDDEECMTGEMVAANGVQGSEDEQDVAIATARLKKMKDSPKSLVSGDALQSQLDDLLS
jgi:type I restriction enzyme M protein